MPVPGAAPTTTAAPFVSKAAAILRTKLNGVHQPDRAIPQYRHCSGTEFNEMPPIVLRHTSRSAAHAMV
jgi:hypothetical protein